MHPCMQALKKARQFEVRKIVRRLKEAKCGEDEGASGTANAGKLQQQLDAARGLNINSMTAEVPLPAGHMRAASAYELCCLPK